MISFAELKVQKKECHAELVSASDSFFVSGFLGLKWFDDSMIRKFNNLMIQRFKWSKMFEMVSSCLGFQKKGRNDCAPIFTFQFFIFNF